MAQVARSHRYELRFQAAFDDGEVYQTGPVRDLSTTGCFIETDEPLPAGRKLRVIPLTTGDDELCELVGEVTRVEERGMGVRFLPMDDDVEIRVIKFCEKRAAPAPRVPKKDSANKELPAGIIPGARRKARPSPVDTADIIPLNTAEVRALDTDKLLEEHKQPTATQAVVLSRPDESRPETEIDDDHDARLRETLNSIEGADPSGPAVEGRETIVVERADAARPVTKAQPEALEALDLMMAFGPKRGWGWAAWLIAGGALAASAWFGAQQLDEHLRVQALEDETASALVAHARDRAREIDARLTGLADAARPVVAAPRAEVRLETATVPGADKEIAVHIGIQLENPNAEPAAIAFERVSVYLGVLQGRAQPLRALNAPGEPGPVKWSRVQRVATGDPDLAKIHAVTLDAEATRAIPAGESVQLDQDLLLTPGKAHFVAAEVELGVGEQRIRRVELTPTR